MILYRIQDKESGKFFAGIEPYNGTLVMTESGAFFKKIDTIMRHLDYLAGEYVARQKDGFPKWTGYLHKDDSRSHRKASRNRAFYIGNNIRRYNKLYRSRLRQYRIVMDEVALMGQKSIPATKFWKPQHER